MHHIYVNYMVTDTIQLDCCLRNITFIVSSVILDFRYICNNLYYCSDVISFFVSRKPCLIAFIPRLPHLRISRLFSRLDGFWEPEKWGPGSVQEEELDEENFFFSSSFSPFLLFLYVYIFSPTMITTTIAAFVPRPFFLHHLSYLCFTFSVFVHMFNAYKQQHTKWYYNLVHEVFLCFIRWGLEKLANQIKQK